MAARPGVVNSETLMASVFDAQEEFEERVRLFDQWAAADIEAMGGADKWNEQMRTRRMAVQETSGRLDAARRAHDTFEAMATTVDPAARNREWARQLVTRVVVSRAVQRGRWGNIADRVEIEWKGQVEAEAA